VYDGVAAEGRLLSPGTGNQFNHSNIVPANMTTGEPYARYRRLLTELYL
jgi:hypothetical protein